MPKRKNRQNRRAGLAEYRQPPEGDILHFYSGSFALDSAEFEHVGDEEDPSAIAKRALVMIEGSHTDSNKRQHVFDKNRLLRFAANTNAFLNQGGRVPWQQDHQKNQASNLGDLEGEIIPAIITRENLPDPRLQHLVGKLGLFTDRLVARGAKAVQDVMDGKIKTISPGIDLAADIIREISATPTPAIVGLSTFRRSDPAESRMARFALTMEEAASEDQDFNHMKGDFDDLSERFWRVVSDIGNAPPEEFEGEDPSAYLEQAITDYTAEIAEMLQLGSEPEVANGNDPRLGQPPGAAPVSTQKGRFSMANDLSYYSMGDVLNVAEFRGRGPDKQPRKRRRNVAIGAGGLGTVGVAGRYGVAGRAGVAANAANAAAPQPSRLARLFGAKGPTVTGGRKAFREGVRGAAAADRARASSLLNRVPGGKRANLAARRAGRAVANSFAGRAVGATSGAAAAGYRMGTARAGAAGAGRLGRAAGGTRAALGFASRTRGGKAGLAVAGLGAAGTGVQTLRRRRRRRSS